MNKLNKLLQILVQPLFLKAFLKYRVAAGIEHSGLNKYVSEDSIHTIIDIGANRGQFALIARKCFPSTKIISFEPLQEPADLFRCVFKNDKQTILHQFAIGPQETVSQIHVSYADDSSSLLPITSLQNDLYPGTSEKEIRDINVIPLDAVISTENIETPVLMKIDVQGFEKQVLEGCESLLSYISYVYVECSFMELYQGQSLAHEVIAFLAERGFILLGVYNLSFDNKGATIQGDLMFGRDKISNE